MIKKHMETRLETFESECVEQILVARRYLDELERRLNDPTYRLTMSTAEPIRAMGCAYTAFYQATVLREVLAVLEAS